jgi:hypothetical protein
MNNKFRPTAAAGANQRQMRRYTDRAAGAEANAPNGGEREFDALTEQFFSQPSLYPCEMNVDGEFQLTPEPSKRAMYVTLITLVISTVTLGAFLAYMRLIMPVPAELGTDHGLTGTGEIAPVPEPEPPSTAEAPPPGASMASLSQPVEIPVVETVAPPMAAAPGEPREPGESGEQSEHDDHNVPSAEDFAPTARDARPAAEPAPAAPVAGQRKRSNDLVGRAYGSLNRGDASAALGLAREAVTVFPTRADAWIALGSAYDALRDRASAREAFRNCVQRASGPFVQQCRTLARD